MDTSGLESFAQNLRVDLLDGVKQRLRYWGFKEDGTVAAEPDEVEGGYLFRGEVHDDPGVPRKWRALKNAINRHDVDHMAEEAAYTWFNRLVAIRILEKNGYVPTTLGYAEDTQQPAVLYRAKNNIFDVVGEDGEQDVKEALRDSDDDRAFRQLLVGVCHENDLLNDVFGRVSDYTELLLPTGLLDPDGPVERLVTTDAISDDDYEQVELIGWLYQFYISEKKDEVYDKSGKFQPEDIPAATQMFTPHWIVKYMVENTIGKQWLEKYPDSPLREEMEYLVENENESTGERENESPYDRRGGSEGEQMEVFDEEDDSDPTAPIFDDLSELELFDPAAGSGHILVVGFDLLMEMYRERGYTDREAVEQILTENLKGLEIDRRAAQLARFALLMKAAQYDRRMLNRDDLRPEVYAMPEPRDFSTSDIRAYLGDEVFDTHGAEIKEALDLIAKYGQNVGSALKLTLSDKTREAIARCVASWNEKTQNEIVQLDEQALHQELREYFKPLLFLTGQYSGVAMNPPYMGSRRMNPILKDYVYEQYPMSKRDLSSLFMRVGEDLTTASGLLGMINQQTWMFKKSYSDIREYVIESMHVESMLHMGPNAFSEISGEVVQSTSFVLRKVSPTNIKSTFLDLTKGKSSEDKRSIFLDGRADRYEVEQVDLEKIPNSPVAYWASNHVMELFNERDRLEDKITLREGIHTGDNRKFLRKWYEISDIKFSSKEKSYESIENNGKKWIPYSKGGKWKKWFEKGNFVICFDKDSRRIMEDTKSHVRPSESLYFMEGLTWSSVSSSKFAGRYMKGGFLFDQAGPAGFPKEGSLNYYIALFNSPILSFLMEMMNPAIAYRPGNVKKIPYVSPSRNVEKRVENISKICIHKTKEDISGSEKSWFFTQHPLVLQEASSLKAAYKNWKVEATDDFLQVHSNEEELNDLFVDLYGLKDELPPRVALDDITILEDELDRDSLEDLDDERDDLSDEELRQRFLEDDPDEALFQVEVPIRQFLSYGVGVMLGRYRLGRDGLHIAHPNPSSDELAPYDVPVPLSGPESNGTEQFEIDDDAIVPLMGRDSPFSDDAVVRMREIVRLIWGDDTLTENLNFINHALSVGRSRGLKRDYEKTMEEWLVGDFWDWHKSLYSVPYYGKKPIYWLFQSPEGHFQVLVYMHRMDKYTPQRVRQDYLQRYQEWLRREIESLEAEGEETLSGDDAKRLDRLREAAADCREYDAILKDVADQQIEIDLDDGVQNNYPKFGDAVAEL